MRDNNIYWKDYLEQLERENISVEDEYNDILSLIENKHEWYDTFRDRLTRWWANKDEDYIKVGRKKINMDNEFNEVICMPADHMDAVAPRKNQIFNELTDEQREELKLLHWIYLEMETLRMRLKWDYKSLNLKYTYEH